MKTKARKQYLDFNDEWNVVERLLPRGWQEKAKELGAVKRLRGVDSVETLLRMLLVHLADGCSLKETSLRAGRLGWGSISAVGLFKRLRAAEKWLAWMAKELCPKNRLRDAGAIAVDATTVMEAGPKAAAAREVCRRLRSLSGSNRRLGPKAKAQAGYVFVWTSLPASELSPKKALRYYRARWQLELVFKRAKSIMGLGQLPKRSDASPRAWLNGKMLVALLVEKLWQQAGRFSPWGYVLPGPTKPVA